MLLNNLLDHVFSDLFGREVVREVGRPRNSSLALLDKPNPEDQLTIAHIQ
jgi:hypothetical protein